MAKFDRFFSAQMNGKTTFWVWLFAFFINVPLLIKAIICKEWFNIVWFSLVAFVALFAVIRFFKDACL